MLPQSGFLKWYDAIAKPVPVDHAAQTYVRAVAMGFIVLLHAVGVMVKGVKTLKLHHPI